MWNTSLPFTGDPEADALLAADPLALLIGFVLDQQVTVQKAFSGPLELRKRLGHLDALALRLAPQRVQVVRVDVQDLLVGVQGVGALVQPVMADLADLRSQLPQVRLGEIVVPRVHLIGDHIEEIFHLAELRFRADAGVIMLGDVV